jgi:hypothetical protein
MKHVARKTRPIKARPAVSAAPIVVSDLTCFDLVGLTPRQFRDLLARHGDVPRVVSGQRVLVRADVLLRLVDSLATRDGEAPSLAPDEDEGDLSADQILSLVGRRRA